MSVVILGSIICSPSLGRCCFPDTVNQCQTMTGKVKQTPQTKVLDKGQTIALNRHPHLIGQADRKIVFLCPFQLWSKRTFLSRIRNVYGMSLSFSKSLAISLKGLVGGFFQLIGDLTRQLDRQYIFNVSFTGFCVKGFSHNSELDETTLWIQSFHIYVFASFDCAFLAGIGLHRYTFCSLIQANNFIHR